MAVKLHTCPVMFVTLPGHPCEKVRQALNDAGVEYELVKGPIFPRSRRARVRELTGQTFVPVIEFDDGSAYRAESTEMAAEIRAGRLLEHRGGGA
ncbi:MAG: glutathione S-transferase N-terminal domain-containing protein [Thermoleophilia bacterium]